MKIDGISKVAKEKLLDLNNFLKSGFDFIASLTDTKILELIRNMNDMQIRALSAIHNSIISTKGLSESQKELLKAIAKSSKDINRLTLIVVIVNIMIILLVLYIQLSPSVIS